MQPPTTPCRRCNRKWSKVFDHWPVTRTPWEITQCAKLQGQEEPREYMEWITGVGMAMAMQVWQVA